MKVTWLGHSCFKLEKDGFSIIIDPYSDGYVPGLRPIKESADMVFCSHDHKDHNARDIIEIKDSGAYPFKYSMFMTYHDDENGAKRGFSRIYVFDDGEVRVGHFGDIGCELNDSQKKMLAGLDAALIPVGGFFTIDAQQAKRMVEELAPKTVIPMHYRKDGEFGYDVIGTVDEYTKLCDNVIEYDTNTIDITRDTKSQTAVLKYI